MKLLISQINEGENTFRFESQRDGWLKEIVQFVEREGYLLKSDITLEVRLTKLEPDYFLRGLMQFRVEQVCARCADCFSMPVKHGFDIALAHVARPVTARKDLISEESEELDIQFFDGNEIELSPIIQEQFFLSIPYQALCKVDCRGVCQHCGQNLNVKAECGCSKTNPLSPFAVLKERVKRENL